MQNFIKHFYREGRGRWVCFEPADFRSRVGSIHVSPGTTIMRGYSIEDFDLAAVMDAEYERQGHDHP
jgi:hypothetical protein